MKKFKTNIDNLIAGSNNLYNLFKNLCILIALVSAVTLSSCSSGKQVYMFTSFHEPADGGLRMLYSYDGYKWNDLDTVLLKPQAGNQKVMRDPSIVVGKDGTFHLVWTCSWKNDYGFGYSSSKDLINWTEQKHIQIMSHEPSTVNVWAPELFYDADKDEFLIIWASTVPFRFPKGIEDEDNNHRLYCTKTKDFKEFSQAALYFDPGYSSIDATLVKRNLKDYVLVFKDNTRPERNIKVAFGDSPVGPFNNESKPFSRQFTEGPAVLKAGKSWLIYFDAYKDFKYSAVRTNDFVSFEDISGLVSVPAGHKHGTVFKADKKVLDNLLNYFGKNK